MTSDWWLFLLLAVWNWLLHYMHAQAVDQDNIRLHDKLDTILERVDSINRSL